jgi:hypothetical protein
MWNDTEIPLAYLITFRSYGTWLHGDERGSIDRFHNRYRSPYLPRSDRRREVSARELKSEPVTLTASQRQSVDAAIVKFVTTVAGSKCGKWADESCARRGVNWQSEAGARIECL